MCRVLLVGFAVLIMGCAKDASVPVSGPGECKTFTPANLESLASKSDIQSIRTLRDLYLDCDVGRKYTDKALEFAERAAKLGNAEDVKAFQNLRQALHPSASD